MVSRNKLSKPGKTHYLAIVMLLMLLAISRPVPAMQMSDFLWENRPLLLFAPDENDARLQQTKQQLAQRQCQLDDRDMVIGIIIEEGQSHLNNQPISTTKATTLRERYKIDAGRFTTILIGKDGGEKERVYSVPELDNIFALIDGMPMRQGEMMENPDNCRKKE